ncbi:GPI-anchored protein LLG1-like [Cornus florida]|uniref:GPI-anchored protein LLG1-like n=1 Tax=Cornus florida TaxID=4283 RepID=UPI002899884B|nr:GPI-anchored protein LLG1-like [Cornus florida]
MKMEWIDRCCSNSSSSSVLVFLFLFLFSAASASTYISDDIFGSHSSTGRNLLQAKKACPVNFEFLNYTIITSQCKGPQYPPKLCCGALKEFACPYVDELNDLTNDCASTMFSYINLYGKYPPGLFASECREGKLGLECPALAPTESANSSGSEIICNPSQLLMLIAGFLVLLLRLF